MANEEIEVTLGFDADMADLESAFESQVQELQQGFDDVDTSLQSMQSALSDMVRPMAELRDLAKDLSGSFKDAKDAAQSIRESMASTRLQAGLGSTGGLGAGGSAGGGGGLGGLMGLFGGGGLMGLLGTGGTLALGALGTAGVGYGVSRALRGVSGFLTGTGEEGSDGLLGGLFGSDTSNRVRHSLVLAGLAEGGQATGGVNADRGLSATDMARTYGAVRGMLGGIGQGPAGLMSQVIGGAFGAAGGVGIGGNLGADVARTMGLPAGLGEVAGQIGGAEIGRQMVSGMMGRYISEGMQRYPGFLSTSASMASVGQYGLDLRSIRRARPVSFGYGPDQIGPEFSALAQGFGGGPLTDDTLRTSMAFSRAYGLNMGGLGSAIGGLVNIGGGGQLGGPMGSAETREGVMLRVMTDAVASGFGRRLPEFAQAVSSGVGIAISGPGMIRQDQMRDLIDSVSATTANVARTRGVGLQAAGRFLAPIMGAGGQMTRSLLSGGGDPWSMSQLISTNRGRFGGDMYEMIYGEGGTIEAQADPFGAGVELMAPAMRNILRSSSTRYGAAVGVQQLFQGITGQEATPEMIRDIVERGGGAIQQARAEGRDLTDEEMVALLQDIIGVTETGDEDLADTMRDVNERGQAIMREQLGAMRAQAGFAAQQYAISAEMAADARTFYNAQMTETRATARLMRTSAIGTSIQAINAAREAGASQLGSGQITPEQYIRLMAGTLWESVQELGPDFQVPTEEPLIPENATIRAARAGQAPERRRSGAVESYVRERRSASEEVAAAQGSLVERVQQIRSGLPAGDPGVDAVRRNAGRD